MKIEIHITGSGEREDVVKALHEMAESISGNATGTFEDPILCCEITEEE